jgi:hypothetical protein
MHVAQQWKREADPSGWLKEKWKEPPRISNEKVKAALQDCAYVMSAVTKPLGSSFQYAPSSKRTNHSEVTALLERVDNSDLFRSRLSQWNEELRLWRELSPQKALTTTIAATIILSIASLLVSEYSLSSAIFAAFLGSIPIHYATGYLRGQESFRKMSHYTEQMAKIGEGVPELEEAPAPSRAIQMLNRIQAVENLSVNVISVGLVILFCRGAQTWLFRPLGREPVLPSLGTLLDGGEG